MGIGYFVIGFLNIGEHAVGTVENPYRLATPGDSHHVAGLQVANIGFDRRAGGLGLFRWCKRTNKGYDSGNASYATCYGRRDQPGTPATIDELIFFVSHHTPHF